MKFSCPCCGRRTLQSFPGSYEICPVCFWEDDPVQLLDPRYRGGANGPSLMECQTNYRRSGASEERMLSHVRLPTESEEIDSEWRPVQDRDVAHARRPKDLSDEEYQRLETWYYWKRGL